MKRLFSLALMLLMLTAAASAAAQMNYDLPSPHIT